MRRSGGKLGPVGLAIAAGALAALLAGTARADPRDDALACVAHDGDLELDLAICRRAIRSGVFTGASLATLHNARGELWRVLGQPARALAEHDAALAANPASANAWHGRGLALIEAGRPGAAAVDLRRALELFPRFAAARRDLGRAHLLGARPTDAIRDLDAALALAPADAEALTVRGIARWLAGRPQAAAADFERARALGYVYRYLPLWAYLARAEAGGGEAAGPLRAALADLDADEWPRPLVEVYLGRRAAPAAMAAARAGGARRNPARPAEAAFYLGARAAREPAPAPARRWLHQTLAGPGPAPLVERLAAAHLLGRLAAAAPPPSPSNGAPAP